jgi:hypothetical protein
MLAFPENMDLHDSVYCSSDQTVITAAVGKRPFLKAPVALLVLDAGNKH